MVAPTSTSDIGLRDRTMWEKGKGNLKDQQKEEDAP